MGNLFLDQTRLGVWILDGDLHHRGLLRYALPADSYAHTLVMLVVSMVHPWSIIESLERWSEVLTTHIDRLKVPPAKRQEYEEQCECFVFVKFSKHLYFYPIVDQAIINIKL